MSKLFFGVDIQGIIGDATAGQLPGLILRKKAVAEMDEDNLSGPGFIGDDQDYNTEGTVNDWKTQDVIDAANAQEGDAAIILIAKKLVDQGVSPTTLDTIIDGSDVWTIISTVTDAANAKWICHCRK